MANPSIDQIIKTNEDEETQNETPQKKKGGFITMPFIIVNESLERVASYGLLPNMVVYLMEYYFKMNLVKASNILYLWNAVTNFMPIVGAIVADSYLGRFLTIGLASLFSFLGMVILWLTAMIPGIKPTLCDPKSGECESATGPEYTVLVIAFGLMSIGAGGVRPCSQAFGADQVDKRDDPRNERVLETFFNWYYACSCLSVLIGMTVVVYIQDHYGWKIGFAVPAILMLVSIFTFFSASSLYVKVQPKRSLLMSFAHVIVAAYRNRRLNNAQYYYHEGSTIVLPSNNLRFLNKACMVRDSENDVSIDGSAKNPWRLTTVEEVEELKHIIRVLPIWSSGIMLSINTSQNTFQLEQANYMDRHLSSNFQIPAGSYGMFLILVIVLWIPIYDRIIIPVASKIKGKPVKISVKIRMGIGLFFTFVAMVVSAIVETTRRSKPDYLISAFWLVPQYALNGLAEAFNAIGQSEFFYSEFPKSMSSVATALTSLGMAVANLLASAVVSTVDGVSKKGGKTSWVGSDPNKAHYDYYYWLLAVASFVNLGYYVVCSWAYGPCRDDPRPNTSDAVDGPAEDSNLQ